MRDQIMRNNPQFLSEAELEELQNPDEYTVYFEIDSDGNVHLCSALPCCDIN